MFQRRADVSNIVSGGSPLPLYKGASTFLVSYAHHIASCPDSIQHQPIRLPMLFSTLLGLTIPFLAQAQNARVIEHCTEPNTVAITLDDGALLALLICPIMSIDC